MGFIILVHPRPRVNLDINFGDRIGGRITVEVGLLFLNDFCSYLLMLHPSQPITFIVSVQESFLPSMVKNSS